MKSFFNYHTIFCVLLFLLSSCEKDELDNVEFPTPVDDCGVSEVSKQLDSIFPNRKYDLKGTNWWLESIYGLEIEISSGDTLYSYNNTFSESDTMQSYHTLKFGCDSLHTYDKNGGIGIRSSNLYVLSNDTLYFSKTIYDNWLTFGSPPVFKISQDSIWFKEDHVSTTTRSIIIHKYGKIQ